MQSEELDSARTESVAVRNSLRTTQHELIQLRTRLAEKDEEVKKLSYDNDAIAGTGVSTELALT